MEHVYGPFTEGVFRMYYGRRFGKSTLLQQFKDAGLPVLHLHPEIVLGVDYGATEAAIVATMRDKMGHIYVLDSCMSDVERMKEALIERFATQELVAEEPPKRRRKNKGERKRNAWRLR